MRSTRTTCDARSGTPPTTASSTSPSMIGRRRGCGHGKSSTVRNVPDPRGSARAQQPVELGRVRPEEHPVVEDVEPLRDRHVGQAAGEDVLAQRHLVPDDDLAALGVPQRDRLGPPLAGHRRADVVVRLEPVDECARGQQTVLPDRLPGARGGHVEQARVRADQLVVVHRRLTGAGDAGSAAARRGTTASARRRRGPPSPSPGTRAPPAPARSRQDTRPAAASASP